MSFNDALVMAASVVAVDVGKKRAALSVRGADRIRLFAAVARSTSKSSAVYSAWSTLPLNPLMSQIAAPPSDVPPPALKSFESNTRRAPE